MVNSGSAVAISSGTRAITKISFSLAGTVSSATRPVAIIVVTFNVAKAICFASRIS